MARLIREAIIVALANGKPCSFTWRQRAYSIVAYIDDWRDTGEWWSGEQTKDFWRVKTACGGLFDLYMEPHTGQWTLYKAFD